MAYSATQESNEVGSPSARLKAFSNTPQPKPDGRQSQGVTPRSGNAGFPMNLASEAGIMKSKNSPAQRVPKILNTQHLTISPRRALENGDFRQYIDYRSLINRGHRPADVGGLSYFSSSVQQIRTLTHNPPKK